MRTRFLLFLSAAALLSPSGPIQCAKEPDQPSAHLDTVLDLVAPVSVLPFVWSDEVESKDREKTPELPQLVREVFAQSFAALPYEDMDLDRVNKRLVDTGLSEENRWQEMPFPELASQLGAGSLVRGEIAKSSIGGGGLVSKTAVGIRIALIDGKTGTLLWQGTAESSRRGGVLFHAGQARELVGEFSSDDAKQTRELRTVTKEAVRKLLLTIPPPAHLDISKPRLLSTQVNVADGPSKEVQVDIKGTPHCVASFDIVSLQRFIPLWEIEPGLYHGSYMPQPGDVAKDASILLRLESRLGVVTETVSEDKRVTFP
ncbi:MAG: hypothetical protein ABIH23_26525 [bacterium]